MGDRGELGPLDVQLEEPDEIGASQSGLVTTQALASLKEESFDVFETNFLGDGNPDPQPNDVVALGWVLEPYGTDTITHKTIIRLSGTIGK